MNIDISIVVPFYKCSQYVNDLHKRVKDSLIKYNLSVEFIFVNDGSPENDWDFKELKKRGYKYLFSIIIIQKHKKLELITIINNTFVIYKII